MTAPSYRSNSAHTAAAGVLVKRGTFAQDQEAYEQLPEEVRYAIREAPAELSSEDVLALWNDHNVGPARRPDRIAWLVAGIAHVSDEIFRAEQADLFRIAAIKKAA